MRGCNEAGGGMIRVHHDWLSTWSYPVPTKSRHYLVIRVQCKVAQVKLEEALSEFNHLGFQAEADQCQEILDIVLAHNQQGHDALIH